MIYLASPYNHTNLAVMQERYEQAVEAVLELSRQYPKTPVFSPIMYWHPTAVAYDKPRDAKSYKHFNQAMLKLATTVIILTIPGWEDSIGVAAERMQADLCRIPVRYFTGEPNARVTTYATEASVR